MTDHQTTITSVQRWDEKAEVYVNGYRAVCSCRQRSRVYPLTPEGHALAAEYGARHERYHASVARLTASREASDV